MKVWFGGSWGTAAGALLHEVFRRIPVAAFREACDRHRRLPS